MDDSPRNILFVVTFFACKQNEIKSYRYYILAWYNFHIDRFDEKSTSSLSLKKVNEFFLSQKQNEIYSWNLISTNFN